tara:strand:+ start:530 stop:910 length:381 start_codon:yes stop_codon:yes gene_type:complete
MKNINLKVAAFIGAVILVVVGYRANHGKDSVARANIKKSQITHVTNTKTLKTSANTSCAKEVKKILKSYKDKNKLCTDLKRQVLIMKELQTKIIADLTRENIRLARQNVFLQKQLRNKHMKSWGKR